MFGEMSRGDVWGDVQGEMFGEMSRERCPGRDVWGDVQGEMFGEMSRGRCLGRCPGRDVWGDVQSEEMSRGRCLGRCPGGDVWGDVQGEMFGEMSHGETLGRDSCWGCPVSLPVSCIITCKNHTSLWKVSHSPSLSQLSSVQAQVRPLSCHVPDTLFTHNPTDVLSECVPS